jgi:tetratricopeptide (TPR) repeat protein
MDQTDAERQKTKNQVARAVNLLRQRVIASPNDATAMNEYAWLVANTEGNLDEATRYSERSLELMPDYGGFVDTLAHCYAAKKDYETALKHQARAMELEPHLLEIKRAYERFKRLRDQQITEKSGQPKADKAAAKTEP